ncbi:MAG: MATE family efflux transporter [Spirochaetales bacterium]|nr:MATE family efflux transporter [Spirochaetales bacterium]
MKSASSPPINLGKDRILGIFIKYAVPSILAMLAQTTAGLVDSIFIGRYVGPEGIAGITLFFPVLNFIIGFSSMIAIGGVTLAGIHHGRGEQEKSNNYFNVTFFLALTVSIISIFVTYAMASPLILEKNLGVTGVTALYTQQYAQTIAWFFPPFLLNFILSFFLKLDGRPVAVVAVTVSGTVLNVILDGLLVGYFGWEMQGAALATGLSQLLPCIVFLIILITRSHWSFQRPRFVLKEIRAMLFNGSSEFLTMASLAISGFIFNWAILRQAGEGGVAGFGIALQAANVAIMLFYGISDGIQSPVSYNHGAQNQNRVRSLRQLAMASVFTIGTCLALILFFWGEHVAALFTADAGTIITANHILQFFAASFFLTGINIIAVSYYTAIDQPLISAGLSIIRSLIGIVVGLALFQGLTGDWGLWLPLVFTEVLCFVFVAPLLLYKPEGLQKNTESPKTSH